VAIGIEGNLTLPDFTYTVAGQMPVRKYFFYHKIWADGGVLCGDDYFLTLLTLPASLKSRITDGRLDIA
jgi:hypothetical protein